MLLDSVTYKIIIPAPQSPRAPGAGLPQRQPWHADLRPDCLLAWPSASQSGPASCESARVEAGGDESSGVVSVLVSKQTGRSGAEHQHLLRSLGSLLWRHYLCCARARVCERALLAHALTHTLSAAGGPPGCKRACWAFASAAAAAARAMASAASASCACSMAPAMNGECLCVTPQLCVKALQQQRRPWHGACVQPWTASVLVAWRLAGHSSVLPLAVALGGEYVRTPLSSPLRPPSYLGRDLATTGSALTPCLFALAS